ncbi:hypothetical protein HNP69_000884 [Chryseobacterium koreense]|nr:hypothetical protein [Chryseobacterium koreense]
MKFELSFTDKETKKKKKLIKPVLKDICNEGVF